MSKKPFVIPPNLNKKMLNLESTNEFIANCISNGKPFLIARFGSIEGRVVNEILLKRNHQLDDGLRMSARNNAGVALPTMANLKKFSAEYMMAASRADLLAIWNFEGQIPLAQFTSNPNYTHLNFIDPCFSYANSIKPWTKALKNKKCLLIHPFTDSINSQYLKKSDISTIREILPNFELLTLSPPVTGHRTNDVDLSWHDHFQLIKDEIRQIEFDVAIIGAGGYGLPLGAFIKDLGKGAIHLGGVTQLLFGIMGNRWESKSYMDGLATNGWVRPSKEETPTYSGKVEGGCYW